MTDAFSTLFRDITTSGSPKTQAFMKVVWKGRDVTLGDLADAADQCDLQVGLTCIEKPGADGTDE